MDILYRLSTLFPEGCIYFLSSKNDTYTCLQPEHSEDMGRSEANPNHLVSWRHAWAT